MLYIERVISYYQNCYAQEFKDVDILNFTGSKVHQKLFFQNLSTLFTKEESSLLNNQQAEHLYKYIEIHKKVKTTLLSSFFITGKLTFLGKKRAICAPLIFTPAYLKLNSDGIYYFEYSFSENRINESLLNTLKLNYNLDDSFIYDIKSLLSEERIEKVAIIEIVKALQKHISISNELDALPKLLSLDELKNKAKTDKLQILPVVALGIIDKPKSSRGVLNEIQDIKNEHLYNETLENLFSKQKELTFSTNDKQLIYVPSNLSEAQKNIIKTADANQVTVVIGPPGTGKSYTIASLALDQVYRNKSVLICSKTDQAVNVLQHKIVHDIGVKGLSIRAGSGRNHKSTLKKKLESILSYTYLGVDTLKKLEVKERSIRDAFKKIQEIEDEINSREIDEIKKATLFINPKLSFFKRIKKRFVTKKVLQEVPFWHLVELLNHYILRKNRLIKDAIAYKYQYRISSLLVKNRKAFRDVLSILKSNDQSAKNTFYKHLDFKPVLKCLPIWISKSTDIDSILPLEKDLFDIAIIDEASQCDIATMIPVLVRAKKIVVVGDPKQLKHVSFLSKETLEKNASNYNLLHQVDVLNYRQNSFLDYVIHRIASQKNIHFLDEHYRSLPSIIKYSNTTFYDNKLKVMSTLQIHEKKQAINWIKCNGIKQKSGINTIESDRILKDIRELVNNEVDIPKEISTTIGILSPFRDQVDFIKKRIQEIELSAIKKHTIQVGTPFDFQGEERDIMYISFVIDNATSSAVFQYLDREDVFNVSITRAKNQQNLYYSFDPKNFKHTHLLIDYYSESRIQNQHINSKNFNDYFAVDVYEELINLGINESDIKVNYAIANYTIDLLVSYNNKTICIDLVGYPGEFEKVFSASQYKTLFRTNIPIITIPYAYWKLNKKACLTHIKKKLRIKD